MKTALRSHAVRGILVTTWHRLGRTLWARLPERFRTREYSAYRAGGAGSQEGNQNHRLISSDNSTADFLGSSTVAALHHLHPAKRLQSLPTGEIVAGRFEILRFLNSGGMGEVYEAWDCDLKEKIALKTIRPEIASSPSAIELFKREVKQARAISHVNVCRVYEAFSHELSSGERIWFLTMELLEGETLSQRLRTNGPLATAEALTVVEQIVAGLAAAHEHGILHRDFKTSNVMLVNAGEKRTRAVITDFGLSVKILSGLQTGHQEIGGTRQYWAPEQESGGDIGFAADQYALGVVMCEILTGRLPVKPAAGRKALLPPGRLGPKWEPAIRRCLEFQPEDRFEKVTDVVSALELRPGAKSLTFMRAVIAVAVAFAVGGIVKISRDGERVQGVVQLTPDTDLTSRPSLSRDGQFIAYSSDRAEAGNLDIWVQRLPSGRPVRLTTNPAQDVDPNIAPDGSSVVFRSERNGGGIYLTGSAATDEHLLAAGGRNPRFSPDGRSVLYWVGDPDDTVASGKLFLLSIADRSSVPLAADFKDARLPVWSSDGRYVLFIGCRRNEPLPGCAEWWVMRREGSDPQNTGSLALLRQQQIEPVEGVGGWYRDTVIFSGTRGTTMSLWGLTLSETRLKAEGTPKQLTSGDAREVAPSMAENNTIAFEHLTGALHIWRITDATNPNLLAITKLTQDASFDGSPNVSHDGRWLVFSRGISSPHDIWIRDTQSGNESVFFQSSEDKLSPVVDGSGSTIVFEGRDGGIPSLVAVTRGRSRRQLCTLCGKPTGWRIEGRTVFYSEGLPSKIKTIDILSGESKTILEANGYSLGDATWSPENGYLLFTASRSGNTRQVFAVSFPKSSQSPIGPWIPISRESDFSDRPQWSGDGSTVFYLSNRDEFSCVWGQRVDFRGTTLTSPPFAVMHFHNPRFSPGAVVDRLLNISVAGNSIYLNVGEINTSVWTGVLKRQSLFSPWILRR